MAIYSPLIKKRSKGALAAVMIILSGLATGSALAAEEKSGAVKSLYDQKFVIALGGFFPQVNSSLSLDGPNGSGLSFDGDALGLREAQATGWASFNWRFLPRHALHLEYFQLDREGSRTTNQDITLGGVTIGAGSGISSEMDLGLGRATYGFSIIRDEQFDMSFLVGVHIATAKATVGATGSITDSNGAPIASGSASISSSTYTFPLPHIGGSLAYKFSPRVAGKVQVLGFYLDIGDYSGGLVEFDAVLSYQLIKNFGIGGGFKWFNLRLKDSFSGGGAATFEYTFAGPTLFVYGTF